MKKKKVTVLLKEMVSTLASMAKAKSLSLSLHTRITAVKLRLVVFSLLRDRRFPNSIHALLNRRRNHHLHKLQQQPIEDDKKSDALLLFHCQGDCGKSEEARSSDPVQTESNIAEYEEAVAMAAAETDTLEDELGIVVEGGDKVFDEMGFEDDAKSGNAWTHKVFDEIESDFDKDEGGGGGGDWVDLLEKSEEDEFELEDNIDEAADLFIRRIHQQLTMEPSPIHQST